MSGVLMAGGDPGPQAQQIGGNTDISGSAIMTFVGQDLGTATSNRRVIISVINQGTQTISSCYINGVAATVHTSVTGGGAYVAILSAAVPTDATGDVAIQWSGSPGNVYIRVYADYKGRALSTSATDTTTTTADFSINVTSGGITVGVAFMTGGTGYSSSVGFATLDNSFVLGGTNFLAFLSEIPLYQTVTPKTYQLTATGTVTGLASACAHFV